MRYCLLLLLFFCANTLFADPSPYALFLTWKDDPTTTMVVKWVNGLSAAEGICVTEDKEPFVWKKVGASTVPLLEGEKACVHTAFLTELQPNTSYRFRIEGYTDEHTFTTMPRTLESTLTFVIGGDVNLRSAEMFAETNRQVAAHRPAFVVLGGDLTSTSFSRKSKSEWCQHILLWLSTWSQTMRTADGHLIPLLVAIGNHEVRGGYRQDPSRVPFFFTLFPAAGNAGYTTMRFGNYLSLYLLDSGHVNSPGGSQEKWLKGQLEQDVYVPHRIAVYHVSAYPPVRPYRNTYSSALRRHWVPLFDLYHLHLAFENHEHAYKRTYPLTDNKIDPAGVVYIGDGSWGTTPRVPKEASRTMFLEKAIRARQFCEVTISKERRSVLAITYDNQVIDQLQQQTEAVATLYTNSLQNPLFRGTEGLRAYKKLNASALTLSRMPQG